jgi:predicted dinucleotide-binding enzyme
MTQTKIGIISSGKVGRALGGWIAARSASVAFTSRDPKHAEGAALKAGNGAKALPVADLVRDSELILLALPFREVGKVLEGTRRELNGKIVVDVTNPVTPIGRNWKSVIRHQARKRSRFNFLLLLSSKLLTQRSQKSMRHVARKLTATQSPFSLLATMRSRRTK